ncbi:MAG: cytochrome b, partial [Pseudomonadales bacterium]|nr:cytochrome b [Pseudomonadales bacterium]
MKTGNPRKWNSGVRFLHWLALVLLIVAATLGFWAEDLPTGPAQLKLFATHKSVGLSILLLVLVRIAWRFMTRPAPAIEGLPVASQRSASMGHGILYAVLILLPLSGWWLTSVANFPFQWFDLFRVPMLLAANTDSTEQSLAALAHRTFFWFLLVLTIGHVAMVWHHQRKKITVLPRMLPGSVPAVAFFASLALLAALLITWAIYAAGVVGDQDAQQNGQADKASMASAGTANPTESNAGFNAASLG